MADTASRDQAYSVPLSTVVGRRDLDLATVVAAGDPGVGWAVVSELEDPAVYLRGGELLLTAGVNLPGTAAALRAYVASLVGAGVSAVGFGVTPVHDTVPVGLIEQCHLQGLPLVEVPRPTPFTAVSQAVGEELEERRLRDLRRLGEAHQALARAVSDPDPVARVLRVLADSLAGWAALAGPDTLQRTPSAPADLSGLSALLGKLTSARGPRSAKARSGDDEVFLHTVGTPPEDHGVVLVGRPEPLGITDRAVLRTATALLDLLARTSHEAPPVPGRLLTGLLLDGGIGHATEPLLAELTHADPGGAAYRVLRAHARAGRHTAPVALPLGTPVLDHTADAGGEHLRAVLADRGEDAHRDQLQELRPHGWTGALSAPMPPSGLAEADRQAAALLARARATGAPMVWGSGTDPFDTLLDPEGVDDLVRRVLGPLAQETDTARTLRRTLRAWLTRHGNWDRAAADLGTHRNSVRYRIGRIERDLDVDLADAEQRMRLWFALSRRRP
ncbi:PucR-like helix-turn-helix protein [Nocardiopsis sp. Huas11]|uniref:PucR family transcriptional regulator n=1 Tax=Nocardiopsis sp. Huas11 TaxID=2183912 RepID=UPI000EB1B3DF|nr:PucR family transcriptional regulator [Nocardiopsis sp. Huas11]RKS08959.1 PucR-like helix-turn-helix protein [Nocardiopsis sp. Huas11]